MDYKECFTRLSEFAREVKDYYNQCTHLVSGPLLISRQMASLALPGLSASELNSFINQLEQSGHVTVVEREPLSFTPNFPD